nr:EamA family transporter [Moraxella osloensis]
MMFQVKSSLSAIVFVVIASILWGTTGTVSALTPDVSPLATGAFAMGVAGILLVVNARQHIVHDKIKLTSQPKVLLVGAICIVIYPLAFYSSMRLAGVAIGTVITIASAPFFTVTMERLISNKKINKKWVVSFLFGAVGVSLLTIGKTKNIDLDIGANNQKWGILLGLVAGLTYATYSWSARQMIETGVDAKSAMASLFGLSAIVLLPSLLFTGDNLFLDGKHIAVALYMAIAPMFIGYLLFGQALKVIEASQATLITLLEPIVATILAVIVVGEVFSPIGWLGMLLMIICLLLQIGGAKSS